MLLRVLMLIGSDNSSLPSIEVTLYLVIQFKLYPCDLPAWRIELMKLDRPHPHGRDYLSISAR